MPHLFSKDSARGSLLLAQDPSNPGAGASQHPRPEGLRGWGGSLGALGAGRWRQAAQCVVRL